MIDLISTLIVVLLTEAALLLPTVILLRLSWKRIKNVFFGVANEYLEDFMAEIVEKPEFLEKLLEKPLEHLADRMVKKYTGPVGGKVVGELAGNPLVGMLPKKWQGIAQLLLGGRGEKREGEGGGGGKNPFG